MTEPFDSLLEVQEHDTAADQLRHRLATLPERARLLALGEQRAALEARTAEVRGRRDELAAQQQALEEQIEAGRQRRSTLERQLYGGQVSAARDLQAIDEEIRHLAAHVSGLEDRELELMEQMEPLDGTLQAADVERDAMDTEEASLQQAVAEAGSSIEAELAGEVARRAEAAARVPPDLLARYETLRARLGGTGAARLVGNACGGCHLTMPAMEVDRIRKAPPDAVLTCDQCGRILVR